MRAVYAGVIGVVLSLAATPVAGQEDGASAKLSLHDRIWIATQIYDAVHTYFGHWQAVRDLDFDKEFESYLDQIVATDDRVAFDLATLELIAKLRNGHSGFNDHWLIDNHGQMLGFQARRIDDSWVVTESSVADLKRGDIIAGINGQPFQDFFLRGAQIPGWLQSAGARGLLDPSSLSFSDVLRIGNERRAKAPSFEKVGLITKATKSLHGSRMALPTSKFLLSTTRNWSKPQSIR